LMVATDNLMDLTETTPTGNLHNDLHTI